MIITGRLTRDPELRYTKKELPVANFSVAVNQYKGKDKEESVNFFDCIAFNGLADICGKYLKKGSLVAIEGKLNIRAYESNGIKKKAVEVIVDNMVMMDKKFISKTSAAPSPQQEEDLLPV